MHSKESPQRNSLNFGMARATKKGRVNRFCCNGCAYRIVDYRKPNDVSIMNAMAIHSMGLYFGLLCIDVIPANENFF